MSPGKFETWGDEQDLAREVYEDTLDSTYAQMDEADGGGVIWLIQRDDGWWTVREDDQGFFERLTGPTDEARAIEVFEDHQAAIEEED